MISIEHDLSVTVVGSYVDIIECGLQCIRTRVVNGSLSHIVSLFEVALSLAGITRTLRIGRNVIRVLQPPCIGQVSL